MILYDVILYYIILYDIILYDMIWYDMMMAEPCSVHSTGLGTLLKLYGFLQVFLSQGPALAHSKPLNCGGGSREASHGAAEAQSGPPAQRGHASVLRHRPTERVGWASAVSPVNCRCEPPWGCPWDGSLAVVGRVFDTDRRTAQCIS